MKTNIKMRVTPEQSEKVQRICFNHDVTWCYSEKDVSYTDALFLFIKEDKITHSLGMEEAGFLSTPLIEVDADLFIRTNGTCKETEENKMEWTPYNGQDLEVNKDYLCSTKDGIINVATFVKNNMYWQNSIIAYAELPKPYEKPKSLKERLDEAVEEYCYEFSDEEWKDVKHRKHFIIYAYDESEFYIDYWYTSHNFSKYTFKTEKNAQSFIDSFTTDELMQIMKGEVK